MFTDLFARPNSRPRRKCHLQSPRNDYRYPFEVSESPNTSDDESRKTLRPSHAIITISSLSPPLPPPLTNLSLSPLEFGRDVSESQRRNPVEVNLLQTTGITCDWSEGQCRTPYDESPLHSTRTGLSDASFAARYIDQSDFSLNETGSTAADFGKYIDEGDRRRQRNHRPGLWKRFKMEMRELRCRLVRRLQLMFMRRSPRNSRRQKETNSHGGNIDLHLRNYPMEQFRQAESAARNGSGLGHHNDHNSATDHHAGACRMDHH